VTGYTDVVTANVLRSLPHSDARLALQVILDGDPDLVGLQEWGVSRHRLLRETGRVHLPMAPWRGSRRTDHGGTGRYVWVSSPPLLGGCPVGARMDRFDLIDSRITIIGGFGRADRNAGPPAISVPRIVTIAVLADRQRDRVVSVVNYHLTPGVEAGGRYRPDRPLLVARHRAEVRTVGRLVLEQLALGREVYALGDSNFDRLSLPRLVSAWEGRDDTTGTLVSTRRKIDDVHGPGPATSVTLLPNPSDHVAVLVRRADPR
jgi:hypothetical protein